MQSTTNNEPSKTDGLKRLASATTRNNSNSNGRRCRRRRCRRRRRRRRHVGRREKKKTRGKHIQSGFRARQDSKQGRDTHITALLIQPTDWQKKETTSNTDTNTQRESLSCLCVHTFVCGEPIVPIFLSLSLYCSQPLILKRSYIRIRTHQTKIGRLCCD